MDGSFGDCMRRLERELYDVTKSAKWGLYSTRYLLFPAVTAKNRVKKLFDYHFCSFGPHSKKALEHWLCACSMDLIWFKEHWQYPNIVSACFSSLCLHYVIPYTYMYSLHIWFNIKKLFSMLTPLHVFYPHRPHSLFSITSDGLDLIDLLLTN